MSEADAFDQVSDVEATVAFRKSPAAYAVPPIEPAVVSLMILPFVMSLAVIAAASVAVFSATTLQTVLSSVSSRMKRSSTAVLFIFDVPF